MTSKGVNFLLSPFPIIVHLFFLDLHSETRTVIMKEYSKEELMEFIEMDIALRDDQPSCSVVYWFMEPKELLIVRLIKRIFK